MDRRIKKFSLKFYISEEANKDCPNLVDELKNKFATNLRKKGYLPITKIISKEELNILTDEKLFYLVCRTIYVGKRKAFDKILEEKLKQSYQKRIIQW